VRVESPQPPRQRISKREAASREDRRELERILDLRDEWKSLDIEEQNRRNVEMIDRWIVPWEKAVEAASGLGRNELAVTIDMTLVFMHVPKTGGTTLEHIIAKNQLVNGLIHVNAPDLERNPLALLKKGGFPRVVMGHHKRCQLLYQLLDRPLYHITLLREPIGRIISYFNYLQTNRRHKLHEAAREMNFEEFLDSEDMVELNNGQTLRIAGLLKKRVLSEESRLPDALEDAKEMLRTRFTFFGVTEQYAEFLLMAQKVIGWKDIYFTRKNVSGRAAEHTPIPDSLLDAVRERNQMDIELYDFARQLFETRAREVGITPDLVERFNERNQRYEEIVASRL